MQPVPCLKQRDSTAYSEELSTDEETSLYLKTWQG